MKRWTRILALLLCCGMLMGMLPVMAAGNAVAENFDNMETGKAPTGWTATPENDPNGSGYVQPVPVDGDKALHVVDDSTTEAVPATVVLGSGYSDLDISFRYRLEGAGMANAFSMYSSAEINANTRKGIFRVAPTLDGSGGYSLQYYTGSAYLETGFKNVTPGQWYNIRLVLKNNAATAELYVDDQKICDITVKASLKMDRLLFMSNNAKGVNDRYWIDDLKITSGETVLINESFESDTLGSNWTVNTNSDNCYAKVETTGGTEAGNMLLVKDDNPSEGPARATYAFTAASAVEVSFQYRMGSANGVNAIGLFSGGNASNQRKAGIGIFENADGTGTLKHIGKNTWTAVSGVTIVPGAWYEVKLVLNGSNAAELYLDGTQIATFAVGSQSTVNQLIFQTNNAASVDDVFWVDDVTVKAGDTTKTFNFDNADGWTLDAAADNCKAALVVAPKGTGNALRIEDNTTADAARVQYEFVAADELTVSFDYRFDSVTNINAFGLFNGDTASVARKGGLGVVPNGDGTGCLKYINLAGNSWVATAVSKLQPYTWYRISMEFIKDADYAVVYLDGEEVFTFPVKTEITTMDRLIFQTSNAKSVGDVFWIDNVKLGLPVVATDAPEAFLDTFDSENDLENYSSGTVADGALVLTEATDRTFDPVRSGRFGFRAKVEDLTDLEFALLSGEVVGISMKAAEDGSLQYKRDSKWLEFAEPGSVAAGQWLEIEIDLPLERNADYARVYVNDTFVGTAIYDKAISNVNALRMNASVVDDVWADESEGILEMPERTETAPTVYVPEVVESTAMILVGDTTPASGVLANAEAGAVTLDQNRTSFGVDLGTKQRINALRVTSTKTGSFNSYLKHYTVWYSDDNASWTQLQSYTYNSLTENGVRVALFEFSGVEARYVKINTTQTRTSGGSLTVSDLTTALRAERRVDRQWKLAAQTVQAAAGETAMTLVTKQVPTVVTTGQSIGLNFGIHSAVEAVELIGTDLSAADFTLWYSLDNETYTQIADPIVSTGTADGRQTLRYTFDSLTCGYVKLTAVGSCSVSLDSLQTALAAYSSEEIASGATNYPGDRGAEGDFYTRADGTLVMGFNGFEGSSGDFGDATLNARASTDGGYTWGEEWVVATKQDGSVNVMQSTYLWLDNGDLLLFNLEKETEAICNVYMRRSTDGGENFGDPVLVTDEPQGYTITSSGNRVLRLPSGRILLPVGYSAVVNDVHGSDRAVAYVWYSDDDGATWHRSKVAVTLPHAALEPCLALTADGLLMMTLRTRSEGKIYQTISADGGETWAQAVELKNVVTPSATNTIMTVPATGDVALFWNNEYSTGNGSRTPLTVAISADNGLTYQNVRNLLETGSSVPWPAVAFYGRTVLVMYGSSTNLKILDVAELYQTTSGLVTTADLPKAATPEAVYENGLLSGVSRDMQYSLDGGENWIFAGGNQVQLPVAKISADELLVKNLGTAANAPSDVQTIAVDKIAKFEGVNVSLENDLSMHFFMDKELVPDAAYAVVTYQNVGAKVEKEKWTEDPTGEFYKITFSDLAAKEMTNKITVQFFDAAGNAISEEKTDSIRSYAMRMLTEEDSTDTLKSTLVDMLNYGAAAQTYFGYNTDDLANRLLTAEQQALATESITMTDHRVKSASYYGTSLSLEENIVLNFYFKSDMIGKTAKVTFTPHNADNPVSYEVAAVKNGSYAQVVVDRLVVADGRTLVTVEIGGQTVTDSIESYCARMQDLPLSAPLMKFAASAYAQFH